MLVLGLDFATEVIVFPKLKLSANGRSHRTPNAGFLIYQRAVVPGVIDVSTTGTQLEVRTKNRVDVVQVYLTNR